MPRLYHSPSSAGLVVKCMAAAAYRYIDNIQEPRVRWSKFEEMDRRGIDIRDTEYSYLQRAGAFGEELHKVNENYFRGKHAKWNHWPGQVAEAMHDYLPNRDTCGGIQVEHAIGAGLTPEQGRVVFDKKHKLPKHAPPMGVEVHGIVWAGFRDLLVHDSPEALHEIYMPDMFGGVGLFDYKSTSQLKLMMSGADLRDDIQQNLYALDGLWEFGLDAIPARWVYGEKDKRRAHKRALPVDVVTTEARALEALYAPSQACKEFDQIERSQDAPKNVRACGLPTMHVGGCTYHHTNGGPCMARRSVGALVQLGLREKGTEAMSEASDKFAAAKAARKAKAEGAEGGDDAPAPEKPTRTRKPRAEAGAKKTTKKTGARGKKKEEPKSIVELAEELKEVEAVLANAEAEHTETKEAFEEAETSLEEAETSLEEAVSTVAELKQKIAAACQA